MKKVATVLLLLAACAPSGKPSGRFETPYALELAAYLRPVPAVGDAFIADVATSDFNRDGLTDLAVAWADPFVTVSLFGDSSLGVPLRLGGDHAAPLVAFDDALITKQSSQRLQLSRWSEERRSFDFETAFDIADRPMELVIEKSGDGGVTLFTFGANSVQLNAVGESTTDASSTAFAIADLNGDGFVDLVFLRADAASTTVFLGSSSGLAEAGSFGMPTKNGSLAAGAIGDAVELLVASEDGPIRRNVWRNGQLEPSGEIPLTACTQLLLTDVDGNGSNDLIGLCGGVVEVLRYVNGSFESINRLPVDGARVIRRGDVNGDGLADLLIIPRSGIGTLFVARARAAP